MTTFLLCLRIYTLATYRCFDYRRLRNINKLNKQLARKLRRKLRESKTENHNRLALDSHPLIYHEPSDDGSARNCRPWEISHPFRFGKKCKFM